MHRKPVLAPRVTNNPGPSEPIRQPARIAVKESPSPRKNVVGPRTPRARVVIQAFPDEKRHHRSEISRDRRKYNYLEDVGLFSILRGHARYHLLLHRISRPKLSLSTQWMRTWRLHRQKLYHRPPQLIWCGYQFFLLFRESRSAREYFRQTCLQFNTKGRQKLLIGPGCLVTEVMARGMDES
jgi:hypothetical protein